MEAQPKKRGAVKAIETHPHLKAQWHEDNDVPFESLSKGSKYRAKWICENGHIWHAAVGSRTGQNSGCRKCNNVNRPEIGDALRVSRMRAGISKPIESQIMIDEWNDDRDIKSFTAKSNVYAKWKCSVCANEWQARIYSRTNGHGCPTCAKNGRAQRTVDRVGAVSDTHPFIMKYWNDSKSPKDFTYGSNEKIDWKCEAGHEWTAKITDVSAGKSNCPRCSKSGTSRKESELFDFVKSLCPDAVHNTRKVIPPQELDIYVPSVRTAIEFNGVYWHSESKVGKNYHRDKMLSCTGAGVKLVQVWEDDWDNSRGVVESMIKAKLGIGRGSVGARKTKAVVIEKTTADTFLDDNHIQGQSSGTHYLGLMLGDELVAVSVWTFIGGECRLDRYASTITVIGGLDKMQAMLDYDSYVTFADLCVSSGGMYDNTGWRVDKVLRPDYKYVVNGVRHHKFAFRLKRFKSDPDLSYQSGLTEAQLAELNGIERIYDAGKIRYVKP